MKATSVSLVAATVFAVGVVGPAMAQTPSTPAPAPAPAAPSKGDTQMDKMDKKDGKAAGKHAPKKKHAAKKAESESKAAETKAPEQPKK